MKIAKHIVLLVVLEEIKLGVLHNNLNVQDIQVQW